MTCADCLLTLLLPFLHLGSSKPCKAASTPSALALTAGRVVAKLPLRLAAPLQSYPCHCQVPAQCLLPWSHCTASQTGEGGGEEKGLRAAQVAG